MFLWFAIPLTVLVLYALWRRPRHPGLSQPTPGLTTTWEERFLGGDAAAEGDLIKQMVGQILTIQNRNKLNTKSKQFKRGFHSFAHAGVKNAVFRVAADVPAHLRIALLQPGAVYENCSVRFSNASGQDKPDSDRDLRGIAVRIPIPEVSSYDLLATNGAVSHARDAWQFMQFALAAAGFSSRWVPSRVMGLFNKLQFIPHLMYRVGIREAIRMLKTAGKQVKKPVASLATETYFSRSPFNFNGTAVRWRLVGVDASGKTFAASGDRRLRDELIARLKEASVVFQLHLDVFCDEQRTSIEDASQVWQPKETLIVGELHIPQQDLSGDAGAALLAEVEGMEFNPWNVRSDIVPLGSLNRARRPVYRASAALWAGRSKFKPMGWFMHWIHATFCSKGKKGDTDKAQDGGKGGCPMGVSPSQFRPKSSRVGIGPWKYVRWNAFYHVLQWFNVHLSRNPYRKVSWDKWPPTIALFYLLGKIRSNRSNALTDPYDYATNDNKPFGPEPEKVKHEYTADGTWTSDRENPQMGAENTRMGSNIPPMKVRPDFVDMRPTAREAGQLRWRKIDPATGREIMKPAGILNQLGGWWIQIQFHGFGGNTKRDPIGQCPMLIPRKPEDNWPTEFAEVDRTTKDPTRITDDGRPTVINERNQAWVQAETYGTNDVELSRLRSFKDGKLLLDEKGLLPPDPNIPGVDLVGFSHNYGPGLSLLHWLFAKDHNALAEHYAFFHPDWDDEKLFQMARKANVAQLARIHTTEWTEDLLQHPALQMGMHADWYGFLGQRTKLWLMRCAHRNRAMAWVVNKMQSSDTIWGMPGSRWEHHDGPYQVPKQFRMVYRLHELVVSEQQLVEPGTNRTLTRIALMDFLHHNTRPIVEKFGYDVLAWSFVSQSAGALTLENMARVLTNFPNMQNGKATDLAELDLLRERGDGTGTFNEFRMSLGEKPVTSFMELTGGDAEMAKLLEIKYEGDVDRVDAGIGILAEPKPEGFALGFMQFYQFVLNAPRRVKSNRHLTEGFTYAEYGEGMNWVEHGGGMLGMLRRHLPGLNEQAEGVVRAFAPWQDSDKFPQRMLMETQASTGKVVRSDLRTLALAAVTAAVGVCGGAAGLGFAVTLLLCLAVIPTWLTVRRMLAMRFMQQCWQKCYTDKRGTMFGTLERAEHSLNRAATFGRWHAYAVMIGASVLGFALLGSHPLTAALLALVALSSIPTCKWSNRFAAQANMLMIALRNRMRVGQKEVIAYYLEGSSARGKRRGVSADIGDFNARLYGQSGYVDRDAFDRMFRQFAPGRDYLTAYDFERMHEMNSVRDAAEGVGNLFTRWLKRRDAKKQTDRLLNVYADRIVEQDRKLVSAISRDMLEKWLWGVAQAMVQREEAEGDFDPSTSLV